MTTYNLPHTCPECKLWHEKTLGERIEGLSQIIVGQTIDTELAHDLDGLELPRQCDGNGSCGLRYTVVVNTMIYDGDPPYGVVMRASVRR